MKGFPGQYYIYDMTHQIYDMKPDMIWCNSMQSEAIQFKLIQTHLNWCKLMQTTHKPVQVD